MILNSKRLIRLILCVVLTANFVMAQSFTAEDYKRALWMATRFYGGQRSGTGPNWLNINTSSFVKDSYKGKDVSGGWFDCGDHVMYGQTQYYSAYVLAKAFETFPSGFYDLYNGVDYSGYVSSGNWDLSGGTPNGIPDIIDELVYETDFIAKAAISATEFVAKKGVGTPDHNLWVTPGYQSVNYTVAEGGESNGSREITVNMGDGSMASYAAATLALMSRILTQLGIYPEKASVYAAQAPLAYAYASANRSTKAVNDGGAYPANARFEDDFGVASLEMYKLTNDATYLNNANSMRSHLAWHSYIFNYSNNDDIALYNYYSINNDASALSELETFMNNYSGTLSSEKLTTAGDQSWGSLRYPANAALIGALYNSAAHATTYDTFIYNQIDFIMGSNQAKQSYITGFCAGCSSSPQHPHHRGVYQVDDVGWNNFNDKTLSIPTKNQFHGSLVGGGTGRVSGTYSDEVNNVYSNEVCTDYNVGLVGALAYIVSKLDPATSSIQSSGVKATTAFVLHRKGSAFSFASQNQKPFSVQIIDLQGKRLQSLQSHGSPISYHPTTTGIVHAIVQSPEARQIFTLENL